MAHVSLPLFLSLSRPRIAELCAAAACALPPSAGLARAAPAPAPRHARAAPCPAPPAPLRAYPARTAPRPLARPEPRGHPAPRPSGLPAPRLVVLHRRPRPALPPSTTTGLVPPCRPPPPASPRLAALHHRPRPRPPCLPRPSSQTRRAEPRASYARRAPPLSSATPP
ncbi:alpha carbonic anhydrase 8-like [Miscanthus floridulus]|uniref:alpha carbonic anhydrase 8-like n=1 Tax=Miscanthus floridulus TaxID=154761 RepID=UPI00345982B6